MTDRSAVAGSSLGLATDELDLSQFSPIPGGVSPPSIRSSSTLTPLVCDERAIARLLLILLNKGGLTVGEAARRLGITTQSVRQYLKGRRSRPSLMWFIRFAELCGARVTIEFPGEKPVAQRKERLSI